MGGPGGSARDHPRESFDDLARDLGTFLVRLAEGEAPARSDARTGRHRAAEGGRMKIDAYVKAALTAIAVALVAIAVNPWLATLAPRGAEAQTAAAKYEVILPKSWGRIIGFSNQNILMEAPDGTLRAVDLEGKPPEYPRVKVQARWQ